MWLAAQIPNALSLARLLATPWVAVLLLRQDYSVALAWVLVTGLTDAVDGLLARRFGWQSRLGAYLDPVADKALLVTVFLCLGAVGVAPHWVIWLVLGRDALILLGSALLLAAARHRSLPPTRLGKLSTVIQITTALFALVQLAFPSLRFTGLLTLCFLATALMAVITGAQYTARGWGMWTRPRVEA